MWKLKEFFKSLYSGWLRIAHAIGRFNTMLILTLMFYLVLFAIHPVIRKLPAAWRDGFVRVFARLLESRWRAFYLAFPTALTLYLMPLGEFLPR